MIILLDSCSFIRNVFGSKKRRRGNTEKVRLPVKDNESSVIRTLEEIRSEALTNWNSGLVYQRQFNSSGNRDYAIVAIRKYDRYYELQPNGPYAGSSLIRMAELAYHIGDRNRSIHELDRIKRRYDLRIKYLEEIKLLEDLIDS